jgi:hypothetical protein
VLFPRPAGAISRHFLMRVDLRRRAFQRAGEILGGKERLATYLGVDSECLARWSAGSEPPPLKALQSVAALLKHEMLKRYMRTPPSKKPASAKRRARR